VFTGLVEAVGTVHTMARTGGGARLAVAAAWPDGDCPRRGDSVAVNGACLTVLEPAPDGFVAELSPETLERTALAELRSGQRVNLERALRLGDRLGGHLVQGHVDAVVRLIAVHPQGGFSRWRVGLPGELKREVARKGSVALHGVSLTVAAVGDDWFEVALIPETLSATVLDGCRPGSMLHLETDVLAKYVISAMAGPRRSAIDELFGSGATDA
jgi:riboflavin synthase